MNSYCYIKFLLSANNISDLPQDNGYEIAIFGRSNAGKSKALNILFKNNKLSKSSKMPGKTMFLNVFKLYNKLRIIDLPGFGYSNVSKKNKLKIIDLIKQYFSSRQSLKILIFLEDIRRSILDFDEKIINLILKKKFLFCFY